MKKLLKFLFLIGCIVAVSVFILIAYSSGKTPRIDGGVAEVVNIPINNSKLFTVIRGEDKNNPVLLMLHGGPGTTELPMMRYFNNTLENKFTVVYYDQRGASNSYADKDSSTLNLNQMIEDTHALTLYLKKRFKKEKIYILGHSWGSYLGLHTVKKYPKDYHAYIGTGQISNQYKSEMLGYQYIIDNAKKNNDKETLKEMTKMGSLPKAPANKTLEWVFSQRQYLDKLHGATYEMSNFDMMLWPIINCKEYTFSNKIGMMSGTFISLEHLFPNVLKDNLFESIKKVDVPIYFLQGKHDYVTSFTLAKIYFDVIEAPKKKFIIFENSAHNPLFEEADKFNQEVEKILL
ncbi:alpha/beta hydrolase [Flammeovirga pectinis]|uniref:Alpha/beta hydrolase n=1 Tax=Flammeovirga pectinis TaxID=2494373 RepID=A0A3S9NY69_9BACT|nr:alpha/beta hydrolase [Flammeovirga pectinis]AZQ60913.1 alpha/beta hydrolase [Flammeovirga pectinis]